MGVAIRIFSCNGTVVTRNISINIHRNLPGLGTSLVDALAANIEPLHGVNLTEKYCTIVATSTGCTQKEDFVPILQKSQPPIVTFIRLKPDDCKAAARPYPIRFSFSEIGAKEFTVSNLFVPSPSYY